MKWLTPLRLPALLLMTLCGGWQSSFAEGRTVLFIGNSYTYAYQMPAMIERMARASGERLIYKTHTPGGAYVREHARHSGLARLIRAKPWDFVTLQTQSQESAIAQADFEREVYPHVQRIVQQIKANDPTTVPLFFMTWGYENGVGARCGRLPYFCTFDGMNDQLQQRYTFYARENQGAVVPAAAVWRVLRRNHPDINLYESDGNHPSLAGVYANACAFYAMIFNRDPTQLNYNEPALGDSTEAVIQQVVKSVVFDQRQRWDFSPPLGDSFEKTTAAATP